MRRPAPGDALFLDFDGVLTGIVADPDAARLTPERARALVALAARLEGALAVVSGRSLADLAARVPEGLWRAGGHGMDLAAPFAPVPPQAASPEGLVAAVEALLRGFPGAWLEAKGPVLAVHYRAVPEAGVELGERLAAVVAGWPGYRLHGGKMVWEAKPEGRDKGRALARLMEMPPFAGRRPVMVGDDVTDEDGFRAALKRGGRAIKVGGGKTLATERLADVEAVWRWLTGGG